VGISLVDYITLDFHVHHDEISTIERVGHDTTNKGCCQNNGVRLLLIKELLNGDLVREIELLMATAHKISVTPLKEIIPNSGTHKSVVSRYIYLTILV
jgi:hypothetical protein